MPQFQETLISVEFEKYFYNVPNFDYFSQSTEIKFDNILHFRPKTPEIEDPDPIDDKEKDVGETLDDIDRLLEEDMDDEEEELFNKIREQRMAELRLKASKGE